MATYDNSHVDAYKARIGQHRQLSAAEETELAHRIAAGDLEARDTLIARNLVLVVWIARKFLGRGMSFDDLVAEGNVGLTRAAANFRACGVRFSTYATHCVTQAICDAIRSTGLVRIPPKQRSLIRRCGRYVRQFHRRHGRNPNPEELSEALGLTESQRIRFKQARAAAFGVSGVEENWHWEDCPVAEDANAGIDPLDVSGWLKHLDRRSRQIITLRHGLSGSREHTLQEVGDLLGLTRERIRQLEARALAKLRTLAESA